jgi:hypothetical protein
MSKTHKLLSENYLNGRTVENEKYYVGLVHGKNNTSMKREVIDGFDLGTSCKKRKKCHACKRGNPSLYRL